MCSIINCLERQGQRKLFLVFKENIRWLSRSSVVTYVDKGSYIKLCFRDIFWANFVVFSLSLHVYVSYVFFRILCVSINHSKYRNILQCDYIYLWCDYTSQNHGLMNFGNSECVFCLSITLPADEIDFYSSWEWKFFFLLVMVVLERHIE